MHACQRKNHVSINKWCDITHGACPDEIPHPPARRRRRSPHRRVHIDRNLRCRRSPPEIVEPNEASVTAGGAAMYPGKNIAGNAVNSADHTTLVAAVVAAGLTEPLSSPGPFTVFASVNGAFAALPAGTVDTFLLPEKKDTLTKVLTAHVVAGDLKAADLIALAAAHGGAETLTTVSGDTLTFAVGGGTAIVTDENSGKATVVDPSNGVIHVVDKVLAPNCTGPPNGWRAPPPGDRPDDAGQRATAPPFPFADRAPAPTVTPRRQMPACYTPAKTEEPPCSRNPMKPSR